MSYLNLTEGGEAKEIGVWTAKAWEEVKLDYNYYSKAWHRSYGPKKTVTGRYVRFTSKGGKTKIVELASWAGNWQLKALAEAGIVKPRKGQMKIRLNAVFDIKVVKKERGYKLYQRTLKGQHVDYCIVSPMGATFHAESWKECLKGLTAKRKARIREKTATVSLSLCKKLGFCDTGIQEFCSVFGFNLKKTYTPAEVHQAVMGNPHAARPFMAELKSLADAVGFSIPELS